MEVLILLLSIHISTVLIDPPFHLFMRYITLNTFRTFSWKTSNNLGTCSFKIYRINYHAIVYAYLVMRSLQLILLAPLTIYKFCSVWFFSLNNL